MTLFNCIDYVVLWFVNEELKMLWKEKIVDSSICRLKYQQYSPWIQAQRDAKHKKCENGGCLSEGTVSEFSAGDWAWQQRNPVQNNWFGEIQTLDVMNAEHRC